MGRRATVICTAGETGTSKRPEPVVFATCDNCGKAYFIGEWPYCPHGFEVDGMMTFVPYMDEHVSENPTEVTSLGQRRALMRANKMDYRGKKVGMPGCEV